MTFKYFNNLSPFYMNDVFKPADFLFIEFIFVMMKDTYVMTKQDKLPIVQWQARHSS